MKHTLKASAAILLVFLLAVLCLPLCTAVGVEFDILNPYENVDWAKARPCRTQLHSHTTASDGENTLAEMVEVYYAAGYDCLAVTDHEVVDRGWVKPNYKPIETFFSNLFSPRKEIKGLSAERLAEITAGEGRDGRGMIRVPLGIEHGGTPMLHVNSWFADWGSAFPPGFYEYSVAIRGVDSTGGLSMINHPISAYDNYDIPYAQLFETENVSYVYKVQRMLEEYDSLIGSELCTPHDRKLWDVLLKNLAPSGRNIFVTATDDSHDAQWVDGDWVVALMPENTAGNLYDSLKSGAFFACSHYLETPDVLEYLSENAGLEIQEYEGWRYWLAGEEDPPEPMVTEVAAEDGVISIAAENTRAILWIADGRIVAEGNEINLAEHIGEIGAYVRAELWGEGGMLYTQPFLLSYEGMPAGRPVPDDYRDWGDVTAFLRMLMYPFVFVLDKLWEMIR